MVGTGYVGLVTGTCLAHFGHRVSCADSNREKIERLSRGEATIVETGLDELLREGLRAQRLSFVSSSATAVEAADFVFLCLPTPQGADGSAELGYLESAVRDIAPHLKSGAILVNKSTAPVGAAALLERIVDRPDVSIVSNPEFLREGSAIRDSLHPDRIVVGSNDPSAADRVAELFAATGAEVLRTDPNTAEMVKYASNAFLAAKLSFVNALTGVCEGLDANVEDVLVGMGLDHRIGFDHLKPGPGWGGSCLPKDTRALATIATKAGCPFPLLEEVIRSNDRHMELVLQKVSRAVGEPLDGRVTAVWGLTFKAGTDDRRDSPAIEIVRRLVEAGALVRAFDPTTVGGEVPELDPSVQIGDDPYRVCESAEVLVVLTEWRDFLDLDLVKVRDLMKAPRIVDARNLFDPARLRALGFECLSLGRR